jgi:hypothetical protein
MVVSPTLALEQRRIIHSQARLLAQPRRGLLFQTLAELTQEEWTEGDGEDTNG